MIAVIAIVRAKPGKGPELEADFRDWAAVVKQKEPGTLQYTLNRSKQDPDLYYAMELYTDEAAIQTHLANFQARQGGGDFAEGPPEIIVLDRVVG